MCTQYYEELLLEDNTLGPKDSCPYCSHRVVFHHRQPVIAQPTSTTDIEKALSSLSTGESNGRSIQLPKWNTGEYKVAKLFLDRCEQLFKVENLKPSRWNVQLLKTVDDIAESTWIDMNIVSKNLTWEDAKKAFIGHFERHSYSAQLEREFFNFTQRSLSVQRYADKYLQLVSQLHYKDSDKMVIQRFFYGFESIFHSKLKQQLFQLRLSKGEEAEGAIMSSLNSLVKFALEIDSFVAIGKDTYSFSSLSNAASHSRNEQKKCIHHPHSNSHTTAECKFNGRNSPSSGQSSSSLSSNNGKSSFPPKTLMSKDGRPIACHNCQGNHYANSPDCPKNKTNSGVTTRSQAAAQQQGVSNSSFSSSQSNTSATQAKTSSSPSAKAVDVINGMPISTAAAYSPLSESQVIPKQKNLMVVINGFVYNTLCDSGANRSFIDKALVSKMNLPVQTTATVSIRLAQSGVSVPSIGQVDLSSEFLFPSSERQALRVQHSFEIMALKEEHNDYHFIIGTDLLPRIFPEGLPISYMTPAVPIPKVQACLVNIQSSPPFSIGDDTSAADEKPVRPTVYTSLDFATEYATCRESLLAELDDCIEFNLKVQGFCSIPDSVVSFVIDDSRSDTLWRRQYPLAHHLVELANPVIQSWLEAGKIEFAAPGCKFNNAMLVVPKKDDDGKWTGARPCLDSRPLNKILISTDKYQIPYIRDAFHAVKGCRIYGSVDLLWSFLQFMVSRDSRPLTAFTWRGQQYQFVGAPFGINSLTSHVQRIVSRLFSDMPFVLVYVDNIVFGSNTWEEHAFHSRAVIERLTASNLRIKPSSIQLGHSELHCLGHVLTPHGVAVDPAKINSIHQWPAPKTGKELQSFLGLCVFLREHVRHYADITGPLEAVKNNSPFEWNEQLDQCFSLVKKALSSTVVLAHPDFTRPFHIATDASQTGAGGVLFQPSTPDEHITPTNIVAICSKNLNNHRRRWPAYKKELFGIVYSLRQFHTYIWGRQDLVIHTDHKPLTFMFESAQLSPSLQQWLDVILDYSFEIRHRDGILNVIPDAVSRMYGAAYEQSPVWGVNPHFPSCPLVVDAVQVNNASVVMGEEEESDADASSSQQISNVDLAIELEKRGKSCPVSLEQRIELMQKAHQFGHFGREAVFKYIYNQGYWWPSMRKEIAQELRNCDACAKFTVIKSGFHPAQYITSNGPGVHFQIDTSVHLPQTPDGHTALLVLIDVFTGFVILRAVRNTEAETIASELWSIFCIIGFPKILQSDNGSEFCNQIMRALTKLNGIEHRFISPYNPRADGKVERAIGTVTMIIKKLLNGTTKHWNLFVNFAQISYNNKINELTGSSPFALMFGRELNELKDYSSEDSPIAINLEDWKLHQEKILSLIYPAISERIMTGKEKMITALNKHRKLLLPSSLPNGSTVMIKDIHRNNKFEPKYIGPYTIVRRAHNGAYVLKDLSGDLLDRHVPADQIKLIARYRRKKDNDAPIYEVNKVIEHRGSPGHYEYLVDWKGYTEEDRSWEPGNSFFDQSPIESYWRGMQSNRSVAAGVCKEMV
jgi:DNA-directed RNA polymerase subunit RPC12/RpoP